MTMHNMPSLPLDVMVRAVKIAIETTVDKLNGKS
jgi:pyrrolidone-carboxylate peptidase